MDSFRLLLRSIVHYRRAHLGLIAGTALCAAILTGALSVGDSVDHTLRTYAAQRLGSAQLAITSGERLFADTMGAGLRTRLDTPVAALLALPGMAIYTDGQTGSKTQINKVQALGVDKEFWGFGAPVDFELGRRDAALGSRLAVALGVKAGDTVALRIAKPGLLSRDAPLSSREEDASVRANFVVKTIVSDAQMGRFSLAPSQLPPFNLFVAREALQELAGVEGQTNLLLVGPGPDVAAAEGALKAVWTPKDAGLKAVQRSEQTLQLESNRIFLDEATEKAALALPGTEGALTYLVNALQHGDRSTPYSFMTAANTLTQDLRDDEIVINAWLSEKLSAQPGAKITVKYFEVLPSNAFVERAREFTVKRVLSMEEFAKEKALVPEFPGLSNVESCKDWKIGMPMDEELLKDKDNEEYWKEYRETPKALVTLAAGQSMWANRFGRLTGVRFTGGDADALMAGLAQRLGPRDVGLEVRNVGMDAAAAVDQAMDLGGLFIGMSFFLLISALVLTALLYAFGAQQRAAQLGTLAALGFTKARVRTLMLCEAAVVALPGAVLGAGLGMGYAWALMIGLARIWQDAIGRIPVIFHIAPGSLAIGVVATIVCALLTAAFTLRRLLRHSATELMHADFTQGFTTRTRGNASLAAAIIFAVCALATVVYAYTNAGANPAETFFAAGSFALIAGLLLAWRLLTPAPQRAPRIPTAFSLALLNATRRRGRSLGIVSSLAAGGFLVLAVSVMQADLHKNADKRWSGTGGYALFAEATAPILDPAELSKAAPGVAPVPMRVFDGDDASCLNLNHAIRPRVLGVDPATFANAKAFVEGADEGLWGLLDKDYGAGVIPALVGDSDTAMWTLKKSTGPENGDLISYRSEAGKDVTIKLVGKLPMRLSVFQGSLLISAKNFTETWPSQEGFRAFLFDAPADTQAESIATLRDKFDRHGLDVVAAVDRLEMFHAVEGTYLNMFLVLGGVGLLLGATATGVVVLRNLLERRREVALLKAVGFTDHAVFRLLAYEYGMLLALGAAIGGISSLVAMLPALSAAHSEGSPLLRLAAFLLVIGGAWLCAWLALTLGLRKTSVASLNAE
jgi:putative ABC transport system permease protein